MITPLRNREFYTAILVGSLIGSGTTLFIVMLLGWSR